MLRGMVNGRTPDNRGGWGMIGRTQALRRVLLLIVAVWAFAPTDVGAAGVDDWTNYKVRTKPGTLRWVMGALVGQAQWGGLVISDGGHNQYLDEYYDRWQWREIGSYRNGRYYPGTNIYDATYVVSGKMRVASTDPSICALRARDGVSCNDLGMGMHGQNLDPSLAAPPSYQALTWAVPLNYSALVDLTFYTYDKRKSRWNQNGLAIATIRKKLQGRAFLQNAQGSQIYYRYELGKVTVRGEDTPNSGPAYFYVVYKPL